MNAAKKFNTDAFQKYELTYPYCIRLLGDANTILVDAARRANVSPQRYMQALFDGFTIQHLEAAKIHIDGNQCDAKGLLTGAIRFLDQPVDEQPDQQFKACDEQAKRRTKFLKFLCNLSNGKATEVNIGELANRLSTSKWYINNMISQLVKTGAIHFKVFDHNGHIPAEITAPVCSDSELKKILLALSVPADPFPNKEKIYVHLCNLSAGKTIHITHFGLQKQLKITPKTIAEALKELQEDGSISMKMGKGGSKTTIIAPYIASRAKGAAAVRGICHGSDLPRKPVSGVSGEGINDPDGGLSKGGAV